MAQQPAAVCGGEIVRADHGSIALGEVWLSDLESMPRRAGEGDWASLAQTSGLTGAHLQITPRIRARTALRSIYESGITCG